MRNDSAVNRCKCEIGRMGQTGVACPVKSFRVVVLQNTRRVSVSQPTVSEASILVIVYVSTLLETQIPSTTASSLRAYQQSHMQE